MTATGDRAYTLVGELIAAHDGKPVHPGVRAELRREIAAMLADGIGEGRVRRGLAAWHGSGDKAGSKLAKAKEYGVSVISEDDFAKLIAEQINPSLKRYRDYLQDEYLPKAREGVAVSDLPDGPACYQAFLRQSTTLTRTPQEVFDLGQLAEAAVDAQRALAAVLGGELGVLGQAQDVRVRVDQHAGAPSADTRNVRSQI